MGVEIVVGSLEEMCALMCDNVIPQGEGENEQREDTSGNREDDTEAAEST